MKKKVGMASHFEKKMRWKILPAHQMWTCDADLEAGDTRISFESADDFAGINVGMRVIGTGIPERTVVTEINEEAMTMEVSRPCTVTGQRVNLRFKQSHCFSDDLLWYDDTNDSKTCVHCSAIAPEGSNGKLWVTQNHVDTNFNFTRLMALAQGPVVSGSEDHVCMICQKKRSDADHQPPDIGSHGSHPFTPHPHINAMCIVCGENSEAHRPVCRGFFRERLYERTEPSEYCFRCRKKCLAEEDDDEEKEDESELCQCPNGPFNYKFRNQTFGDEVTHVPAAWDPKFVPQPAWDGIFQSQFRESALEKRVVQDFITMMLARTILPAKKHDNMDSMVQLNGPGGNGKSVALGVVQIPFEHADIGTISSNAQKQFPFEQAVNPFTQKLKWCVTFNEITNDTEIPAADIQEAAEASKHFQIIRKGREPLTVHWDATNWFTANAFFSKSTGGSMSRRMVLVRFPNQIRMDEADGILADRLYYRDYPSILMTASLNFGQFRASTLASKDLSGVLKYIHRKTGCRYFLDKQREVEDNLNPVCKFLKNAESQGLLIVGGARGADSDGKLVWDRNQLAVQDDEGNLRAITFEELSRRYARFHRGTKNPIQLTPEMCEQPFKSYGIAYDPDRKETRSMKQKNRESGQLELVNMKRSWVYGVMDLRTKEGDGDDDFFENEDAIEQNSSNPQVDLTVETGRPLGTRSRWRRAGSGQSSGESFQWLVQTAFCEEHAQHRRG